MSTSGTTSCHHILSSVRRADSGGYRPLVPCSICLRHVHLAVCLGCSQNFCAEHAFLHCGSNSNSNSYGSHPVFATLADPASVVCHQAPCGDGEGVVGIVESELLAPIVAEVEAAVRREGCEHAAGIGAGTEEGQGAVLHLPASLRGDIATPEDALRVALALADSDDAGAGTGPEPEPEPKAKFDPLSMPVSGLRCQVDGCLHEKDAWMCATCQFVACNEVFHILAHARSASHPVALSLRDGQAWCYPCGKAVPLSSGNGLVSLVEECLEHGFISGGRAGEFMQGWGWQPGEGGEDEGEGEGRSDAEAGVSAQPESLSDAQIDEIVAQVQRDGVESEFARALFHEIVGLQVRRWDRMGQADGEGQGEGLEEEEEEPEGAGRGPELELEVGLESESELDPLAHVQALGQGQGQPDSDGE